MLLRDHFRMWTHLQMLPALESGEETLIGGQAVMEGVMMRAPHSYCIAVRKPDGEIVLETQQLARVSEKYPIFKLPLLRGLGTLGQAMKLGIKALQFSANIALEEEEKAEALKKAGSGSAGASPLPMLALSTIAPGLTSAGGPGGGSGSKPFSNTMMAVQLIFSLGFFIFAYKFVPLWIATQLTKVWPVLEGRIAFNLVDGAIRIAIFLTFLYAVLRTLFTFKNPLVSIQIDGELFETRTINVIVANGQYYGGGIHVARDARMDDGQFEVYVLGDIRLLTALRYLHTFYLGTYLKYPHLVRRYTGTRITAQSDERVLLNLDGEQPGQLPAAIELLPAALSFVVPAK